MSSDVAAHTHTHTHTHIHTRTHTVLLDTQRTAFTSSAGEPSMQRYTPPVCACVCVCVISELTDELAVTARARPVFSECGYECVCGKCAVVGAQRAPSQPGCELQTPLDTGSAVYV